MGLFQEEVSVFNYFVIALYLALRAGQSASDPSSEGQNTPALETCVSETAKTVHILSMIKTGFLLLQVGPVNCNCAVLILE